jgi:hypothetical protein
MERIKEREKYELLEYQLNNLTNTNLANFRHHAARTDLAESSKILDDFVGRRISGQPQKYTPQDALEALDKIVNTRARKNATTLMYIQQELNGLRDKYLLERSTNVLGE